MTKRTLVSGPTAAEHQSTGAQDRERPRARDIERSRRRLVAAVTAAQTALVEVRTRADEHSALLQRSTGKSRRRVLPVDGGVLVAWIAFRTAIAYAGPGDRLAASLRYFAGRRFLGERPDGLLRDVPEVGRPP